MRLSREDSIHPHRKTNERYSVGYNSSELRQVTSVCVPLAFCTGDHLLRPFSLDHGIEEDNIVEIMKGTVFWDVTSVEIYRRFRRTQYLSSHGRGVSRTCKQKAEDTVNTEYFTCCSLLECSICSSTVKKETVSYSEISVISTRLHTVRPQKIALFLLVVILIENSCLYWKCVFIRNVYFSTTATYLFRLQSKIPPLRYQWTKLYPFINQFISSVTMNLVIYVLDRNSYEIRSIWT